MSEYSEVEKPFLDPLAEQGWTVIVQQGGDTAAHKAFVHFYPTRRKVYLA